DAIDDGLRVGGAQPARRGLGGGALLVVFLGCTAAPAAAAVDVPAMQREQFGDRLLRPVLSAFSTHLCQSPPRVGDRVAGALPASSTRVWPARRPAMIRAWCCGRRVPSIRSFILSALPPCTFRFAG